MAGSYTNSGKDAMLDHLASLVGYVSLHSSSTASSSNELSGGEYSRQSIEFGSASDGEIKSSNEPEFQVPGGSTVSSVGFWSSETGGTLYGYAEVDAETYANDGLYRVQSASLDLNK